jgi:competence protein ComEC
VGEDTVIPFLLKNGISSLDLVIMSHCHYDHIGGLIPVLEQLPVAAFMEYPPGQAEPAYLELKEIVRRKGINVITARRGQSYRVGREVRLHILYPEDRVVESLAQGNENNYSLVILLEYGDASVLFTGDMEGSVEYYLTGRIGRGEVDILKVPHHGSNTSSTEPFLDAVSPEAGVIQVGTNLFGHPSPQVLDRLEQRGAEVYRNDNQGAVMMSCRDNRWKVRTMLDNH